MALHALTGLPSSYRVPGQYGEIFFAQGASSAAASAWDICLVMPKSASGTWTVNQRYRVKSEQEAKEGAGAGSPAHRAAAQVLRVNQNVGLWVVPYAETSTGSPAKATGVITFTNDPTGTGVARVRVLDRIFQTNFNDSDTVTTIATRLRDAINSAEILPCVASNAAGVLTLTAKLNGASQGDGTTGVIYFEAEVSSGVGTTVATSGAALGLGTGVAGAEGSTTEAANFTAALQTLDAVRHYFLVTSLWTSTELDALSLHILNKSEGRRGRRSVGIAAHTGTLADGQSLATSQNYERLRIAQMYHADHDPAVIAANVAAVLQKRYQVDPSANLDSYAAPDFALNPVRDSQYWPDDADLSDGINDGLLMIASNDNTAMIVMDCTTRSKNSAGTVDDFRATEGHRISGGDALMDRMMAAASITFANKKLKRDPLLADGTLDPNGLSKLPPNTVTPRSSRGFFKSIVEEFDQRGIIDAPVGDTAANGAAYVMNSLKTNIDPENGGRLEAGFNFQVINLCHQFTIRASETNPG